MGKFQPGDPKPSGSGRKPGTPNHKTLALKTITEDLGIDVPQRLMKLLPRLDPAKQADILLELMAYIYPKRKAADGPAMPPEPLYADLSRLSLEELKAELRVLSKQAQKYL